MILLENFLSENKEYTKYFYPFIVHEHKARNSSLHYDLRFVVPHNEKILWSFAFPKEFTKKLTSKIIGYRTKDHDIRWLTLNSYRLNVFDKGKLQFEIFSKSYLKIFFIGNELKGSYILFHISKGIRNDKWLLKKI